MQFDKLAPDILDTLITIATSDITDFLEIGETTKLKNTIPPEKFAAIQSITSFSNGGIKIKLHNKTKALRLIPKYLDIISDLDIAIATLRKHGLLVNKDSDGKWHICDMRIKNNKTMLNNIE